jgi:hypothetical protein
MTDSVTDMVRRVLGEEKMPVAVAARVCGEYTGGANLHPSTIVRWIQRGVTQDLMRQTRDATLRLLGEFRRAAPLKVVG